MQVGKLSIKQLLCTPALIRQRKWHFLNTGGFLRLPGFCGKLKNGRKKENLCWNRRRGKWNKVKVNSLHFTRLYKTSADLFFAVQPKPKVDVDLQSIVFTCYEGPWTLIMSASFTVTFPFKYFSENQHRNCHYSCSPTLAESPTQLQFTRPPWFITTHTLTCEDFYNLPLVQWGYNALHWDFISIN